MMIRFLIFPVIIFGLNLSTNPERLEYHPLDKDDPILFGGNHIIYKQDTIQLGTKAFFIDGQFSDAEAARFPYVFNSVNEAAMHLTDGTEDAPMVLYMAPYVYWIDDPDDPAIRVPESGTTPYGLVIQCEWLRFYGLTEDAGNVVLACNRGQTIGSRGNFTLFRFIGQGTSSENITFGNFCNVDLEYPLKPELGREKRAPAIVQAQLIHCNGDKILARNTRFISRLNLCPFVGGKRVLFENCHFESTDDALCATGVYLNCTFDFYSSKPFYRTRGTGSVFLNCDIKSHTRGAQYFTKANGQLAVVDTRISSETVSYLGWRDVPPPQMRNFQYNVTLNGKPVTISSREPWATVDLAGRKVMDAYRFEYQGKVIYNIYNLLSGEDDWDPEGIREIVLAAEKTGKGKYSGIPVQLKTEPAEASLETGKDTAGISASALRFGNYPGKIENPEWSVNPEDESYIELRVGADGMNCEVIPQNHTDEPKRITLVASTRSGLVAASEIIVNPSKLDAPEFLSKPGLVLRDGKFSVEYKLDMPYEDQSLVTWYRCREADGKNPVEVAVSRQNKPLFDYELTMGDAGYYILVSVSPKHQRCDAGIPLWVISQKPVMKDDIKSNPKILEAALSTMSTRDQPEIIPGFWTLYSFEPDIVGRNRTANKEMDAWYYGKGSGGSAGYTGLLESQYARLYYTPAGEDFSDMSLSVSAVPFKTAGQGFSIAPLYMDVLIKFDAGTQTGYGLRFIRTTKYHDAVDCYLVKYEKGKVTQISDAVSTSCFRPVCNISIEVIGNKLRARAESDAEYFVDPDRTEVRTRVEMETLIEPNSNGGFGIEYTGGASTLIRQIRAEWR